jgi:hypothetical protein
VQRTARAACCLLACVLLGRFLDRAGEFAGGRVTQWVFLADELAWCLFAVALLAAFLRPRVGAWIALAGCALWTPHLVYPLARLAGVIDGPFKTTAIWNLDLTLSALVLAATIAVSQSAACPRSRSSPQR